MEETIVLNVEFQNQLTSEKIAYEVQVVPETIAWEDLHIMLEVYSDQQNIHVYYYDDDQDRIVIESEEELKEAFKVARRTNNTIRLLVLCGGYPNPPDEQDEERYQTKIAQKVSAGEREPNVEIEADNHLPPEGSSFYLCCATTGLVLDVAGARCDLNAQLILWPRKTMAEGVTNQLWYRDGMTLCSRLNGFRIDISGDRLVVNPYQPDKITQCWTLDRRGFLLSDLTVMVGIEESDGVASAGDHVVIGNYTNQISEIKWKIEIEPRVSVNKFSAENFMQKLLNRARITCPVYNTGPYPFLRHSHQAGPLVINVPGYPYPYPHPSPAAAPAAVGSGVCHSGVVCDNCDQNIFGIRYKCGYCDDFDLCERCEALPNVHDPAHILLKIKQPLGIPMDPGRLGYMTYGTHQVYNPLVIGPALTRGRALIAEATGTADDWNTAHKEAIHEQRLEKFLQTIAVLEGDETIPSGTRVDPGAILLKKWSVRNVGDVPWASKTVLKHLDGTMHFRRGEVSVPYIEPGQCGTISVELTAPLQPGCYESHWKLFTHGKAFGPDLWCIVTVEAENKEVKVSENEINGSVVEDVKVSENQVKVNENVIKVNDVKVIKVNTMKVKMYEREANANMNGINMMDREVKVETLKEANGAEEKRIAHMIHDQMCQQYHLELHQQHQERHLQLHEQLRDHHFQLHHELQRQSAPTTPTNTPQIVTPPYSPTTVQPMIVLPMTCLVPANENTDLDEASAILEPAIQSERNEVTDDSSGSYDKIEADMSNIEQRMPDLTIDCEDDGEDSDSNADSDDFFIVPIPDCFNTNLPVRKEASTTVVVKRSDVRSSCTSLSTDDEETVHKDSASSSTCFLSPPTRFMNEGQDSDSDLDSYTELQSLSSDTDTDSDSDESLIELPTQAQLNNTDISTAVATADLNSDALDNANNDNEASSVHNSEVVDSSNKLEEVYSSSVEDEADTSEPREDEGRQEEARRQMEAERNEDEVEQAEEATEVNSSTSNESAETEAEGQERPKNDLEDLAYNLMSTAMGVASKAATAAFITAKDVYHTLQARGSYSPPRSTWTPPPNTWTPPQSTWTPVQPSWSPQTAQWIQPENTSQGLDTIINSNETFIPPAPRVEQAEPPSPMQQLIEMGFANRELNARVLEAFDNDLDAAVQELLQENQDWSANRH